MVFMVILISWNGSVISYMIGYSISVSRVIG